MKTAGFHRFVAGSLASACLLFSSHAMASGTVRFVIVTKGIQYRQTSATTVTRLPSRRLPYTFEANIKGGSREALAAIDPRPTAQLPAGSGSTSMYKERPALGLGEDVDDGWMFGYEGKAVFDNWGTKTKSELDAAFPPGSYVISVSGAKSFSAAIKAARFTPSGRYTLSVTFGTITSQVPVLAGTTALLTHETCTEVPIVVEHPELRVRARNTAITISGQARMAACLPGTCPRQSRITTRP
jgi:hypothetical protein